MNGTMTLGLKTAMITEWLTLDLVIIVMEEKKLAPLTTTYLSLKQTTTKQFINSLKKEMIIIGNILLNGLNKIKIKQLNLI